MRNRSETETFCVKIISLKLEIIRVLLYTSDCIVGSNPSHLYIQTLAIVHNVKHISLVIMSLIMT